MKTARLSIYLATSISFIFAALPTYAWREDVNGVATISSLASVFEIVLGAALRLVGLAMFIMIILGGFKILTAGSDAKAMESGQKTITSGIIGLVLAVGAWFILLAIQGFTGVQLTDFSIGI